MKKTILLADDSPTIQRLITQTFDGEDYAVVAVSNGDAAARKAEEIGPAAVLADVHMPGKNGYEVCAWLKAHPALGRTPVLLLVGAFEAFDEQEAGRVGAAGRVTKPFEPRSLLEAVSELIRRSEAEAETEAGEDLLGLEELFPPAPPQSVRTPLSEEEIEAIADRVIARLSAEVIEGIAWEVVPEVAERVLRDEVKKPHEI